MAAVATAPGLPVPRFHVETDSLSTIPDPRTPKEGTSPVASGTTTPQNTDHNVEVANLSNKLISAINHQTRLDDALSATRDELEASEHKIKTLEADKAGYTRHIELGELLWKTDVQDVLDRSEAAEQDRKRMEQELENLSQSLFEEANQMVAAARKETEASEQRNEQLRMQVRDTEALLASQQEQLIELKSMMEHMNSQDDREGVGSSGPTSPAMPSHADFKHVLDNMLDQSGDTPHDITPAPPTSFSTMLSPVLRMDLPSYEDFRALADVARKSLPSSRVGSGAYATGSMPGSLPAGIPPSNSSISGAVTPQSGIGSPLLSPAIFPLKETRFYKRALVEDIEPTLRLETAPGLSWLVRRSVISSIVEGSLVVEPMPSATKMGLYPCSLCGENRKDQGTLRTHRFRTSESDSASRYPLCGYCVNRLRSTCDYIGFLRMIKDGHRKTDTVESEKAAWEESVRLRERMFWARIGGGVVPNFGRRDSPRGSREGSKPTTPHSAPPHIHNGTFAPSERGDTSSKADDGLKGIDERLAHYATGPIDSAPGGRPASVSRSVSTDAQGKDPARLGSFASKLRLRSESSEPEPAANAPGTEAAEATSASQNETSPVSPKNNATNDQGLQIMVPGEYQPS